jgi:hypothetical protein
MWGKPSPRSNRPATAIHKAVAERSRSGAFYATPSSPDLMANRAYSIASTMQPDIAHWTLQATPLQTAHHRKTWQTLWQGRFETCPYKRQKSLNNPLFPKKQRHPLDKLPFIFYISVSK